MVVCEVNISDLIKKLNAVLVVFYSSSSIVRDLTLRSAPSFGSFHLIRLLFDEYLYYLIEHKIANKYGLAPLAVMCKMDLKPETN